VFGAIWTQVLGRRDTRADNLFVGSFFDNFLQVTCSER